MKLQDPYPITPVNGPVRASIRPPGSKSITNRALIVAALAEGTSKLSGVLDSVDTRVMIQSLKQLGIPIEQNIGECTLEITGCGGRVPAPHAELYLENSGTSIRFLTALCACGSGTYQLDGNTRMRERPIGDLVYALQQLGLDISYLDVVGFPPIEIRAGGPHEGTASVAGNISSQYLSALLMAAPAARDTVTLNIDGELVSKPYIEMTLQVMNAFGGKVQATGTKRYVIEPHQYRACDYAIEPDASAASYFFGLAAVTGGEVTVEGLTRWALQGDALFVDALERMGCIVEEGEDSLTVIGRPLKGIDIDMNAISDTAQTLSAVAVFADGPTTIRNIAHVRHKETDRISAVATELTKLGQGIVEFEDGLTIHPRPVTPAIIDTYDDHRMAMSFSLIGLKANGIQIADPGCTAKTYPHYWDDLEQVCGY
ncbi:3-phosphoshikimate 1-carboxyvinyltransferase [Calycomorphotria hydatis]|uniref:3-phosphoshikimate 1-carboxyvinyltransferase n=1 Tax=Calycomorphotria hydatis TaxID=2528027 RepID=A0A517TEV9_9PLAN|nr:3-phosphoshikimate 1-carboxyvinyltransferase [Calycomorphotria hydatis]QDT66908.1 3-phosphoshikimate 1-carboxyvinyltransferase [Calycomorphotria hydatis]